MNRALGNMETALVMTADFAPMTVAAILRLSGAPEPERVRAGLDELQRRHSLLRARITRRRRRFFFETVSSAPEIPMTVLERTSDTLWHDVTTTVLNRSLDTSRPPMLECTYLRSDDSDEADLVLAYHHTIMDGVSAANLFDELLRFCADESLVVSTHPAKTAYPRSIDELVPASLRGRQRIRPLLRYVQKQSRAEFAYQRGIKGRRPPIASSGACAIETRSLDLETTNRLVGLARRKRLTTNSVVGAALLGATYDELHRGDTLPMRAITFANLRNELSPQPSAAVLGCYISMMRYTLAVGPTDDLWSLARSLQGMIRDSITHREHLLAGGMAKQLMTMILGAKRMRMADTALSYAGPTSIAEQYGDISVTDVHGFISTNRLGPQASALVQIVAGRLTWDFVFFDGDFDKQQRSAIADQVRSTLIESSR